MYINFQIQQIKAKEAKIIKESHPQQNKTPFYGVTIWFEFYGISNLVGNFMPNPIYTYISNIYDFSTHFIWVGVHPFVYS